MNKSKPPVIALVVLLVVTVLVANSLINAAEPPPLCMDTETHETIRGVMLEGITAGLRNHTTRLYDVWLKDASEQPDRAAVGMRNGISAYLRARRDIEKWTPLACKGEKQ